MCKNQEQQQQQPQNSSAEHQSNPSSDSTSSSPPSPTTAYALFLHREELRRKKARTARASMTKIQLTSELIAKTKQNINKCSFEDLEILARETLFRKNLQRNLHYKRMQLKAIIMARKQGKIVKKKN